MTVRRRWLWPRMNNRAKAPITLDCIILAAGAASRFGSNKLVADYQGKPLITHAHAAAQALSPARIIVVSGAGHAQLHNHPALANVELHYCSDWQKGMGHSLAFGVSQLNNNNAVMILLGDQPRISAQDLGKLFRLWQSSPEQIACANFSDTLGVPAIFPASFKAQLRECSGDRGAKSLLFTCAQEVLAMAMPSAEFDVDTLADLAR
jgi:molybdenum cofactor cytidylyltransferase